MFTLNYQIESENGRSYKVKNNFCFADLLNLEASYRNSMDWGELEDTLGIDDIVGGNDALKTLTVQIPVLCEGKAFTDYWMSLPVFKGKCTLEYVACNIEDCGLFDGMVDNYSKGVCNVLSGYYHVKVALNDMPVELTFTMLSMVRYLRDFPLISERFEEFLSMGYHPYLAFITSQLLFETESVVHKVLLSCLGEGHHCLTAGAAFSDNLIRMLYHNDMRGCCGYSESYAELLCIPDECIQFNSPAGSGMLGSLMYSSRFLGNGFFCGEDASFTVHKDNMAAVEVLNDHIAGVIFEQVATESSLGAA